MVVTIFQSFRFYSLINLEFTYGTYIYIVHPLCWNTINSVIFTNYFQKDRISWSTHSFEIATMIYRSYLSFSRQILQRLQQRWMFLSSKALSYRYVVGNIIFYLIKFFPPSVCTYIGYWLDIILINILLLLLSLVSNLFLFLRCIFFFLIVSHSS